MNHKCLTPEDEKSPLPPFFKGGVLKSPFGKGGFRQQCPVRFLHVTISKYHRKNFLPEAIFYLTT
jgi:hypothetical protein